MASPTIPEKMSAAQLVEYNKPYSVNQIPTPTSLAPHDLLIRVAVASLCHTDSMAQQGFMGTPLPCTASHEGAGTIVTLGSAVTSFQLGDRIMAGLVYHTCGACSACLGPENYTQYCQRMEGFNGISVDGFFAEYARVDSRWAAKIPDNVTFETAAPMACAGITIYRGILLSDVQRGEWIGIVGSGGGLGHLGVQFAKARGMNVVGIDARDEGLELTKQGKADVVIDARLGQDEVVKRVQAVTGGEGVKTTLNVSDADSAAALGCAITRMHGTLVQIAQPPNVTIPFRELIFRDIRVRGSVISSANEAREMLDVVAEHGISVHTNPFDGLGEVEDLIHLAKSGKMKGKGIVILDKEAIEKEKRGGKTLV